MEEERAGYGGGGGGGLHQGIVGQQRGCIESVFGRGDRVSAYPDWTAKVEETPGLSLIRSREVPRPSLMIDEEVRGWHPPPRRTEGGAGTTAYQAWRMWEVKG